MNNFLVLSALSLSVLISGCAKVTAYDYFATDSYYEKALTNIQKATLTEDNKTIALIHAVYLNNVDNTTYKDGEYFYIALHVIAKGKENEKGLNNPAYRLRLENNVIKTVVNLVTLNVDLNKKQDACLYLRPILLKELEPEDALVLSMPAQNKWNSYYLVKYKTVMGEKLKLVFEKNQSLMAELDFVREE